MLGVIGCKLNFLTCGLVNYKLNARGQSWHTAEILCILNIWAKGQKKKRNAGYTLQKYFCPW